MQYQPPTIDYQTQQFSLTSTFPCPSTSIVANNTSWLVGTSFHAPCPVPQPQMFSTTPTFSTSAANIAANCDPSDSSWHSGMAPNRYQIVLLEQIVKKCYGCGTAFADKYRRSPHNLVLKHVDRRITGKSNTTGRLLYSNDFSNTYYHLNAAHAQKKYPFFNGLVYITSTLHRSLDHGQQTQLYSCGLNVVIE